MFIHNYSDKLIPLQRPSRNCNTLAFSIPSCRTSIRRNHSIQEPLDWNALKDASVGAPSLEAFKASSSSFNKCIPLSRVLSH